MVANFRISPFPGPAWSSQHHKAPQRRVLDQIDGHHQRGWDPSDPQREIGPEVSRFRAPPGLTGAPENFVCQVRELFSRKGIPLSADASPYLKALEEAFQREETIRTHAHRARRNIEHLAQNFNKIGRSYVKQLEQLRRIQSNLESQSRRLDRQRRSPRRAAEMEMRDDRRLMIGKVSDEMPMVPGPEEEQ